MSSELIISVKNLSKTFPIYARPADRLKQFIIPRIQKFFGLQPRQYYKTFNALSNISFEISRSETVGIIGRNGAGKSTLLQILCGTLAPTMGQVQVKGRVAALLELGAGFNGDYTGRENIYMNARILGLNDAEIDARFNKIVDFADIGEHLEQPVKTYSSGMYVRLAFAVIAHVDADILIIDEALAVGDAFFTQKCMRFLRDFMQHGTVLFVSHDTASVRSLCKRAIWLDKGALKVEGLPKDVCELYLEAFFEAQQGAHTKPSRVSNANQKKLTYFPQKDQRHDFINGSNLRNDIQLFSFSDNSPAFGKRAAEIVEVSFLDQNNHRLTWIVGGEDVILRISAKAIESLDSVIIGFHIKDRLGQTLFGDNTFLTTLDQPVSVEANTELVAEFRFQMPRLSAGDYSVSAAIADGTQTDHVQHHWIHDALMFRSESSSVAGGIMGIPMTDINISKS